MHTQGVNTTSSAKRRRCASGRAHHDLGGQLLVKLQPAFPREDEEELVLVHLAGAVSVEDLEDLLDGAERAADFVDEGLADEAERGFERESLDALDGLTARSGAWV